MKPIIKFWITSILLLFPLILAAAPKARGNVEMKDGTVYTDVEVEVPAGTMEEFKIKADNKKSKSNRTMSHPSPYGTRTLLKTGTSWCMPTAGR